MKETWDFSGWVTKYNIRCADGRKIKPGAFKSIDGKKVPLVWQHDHNSIDNVLGHMLLEDRAEGVYGFGKFNSNEMGNNGKELVNHGDITSLSIYANQLQENKSSGEVYHGIIREVSLVLAGANPGAAIITQAIVHSDSSEELLDEAEIYYSESEKGDDLVMVEPEQNNDSETETEDNNTNESVEENQNGSDDSNNIINDLESLLNDISHSDDQNDDIDPVAELEALINCLSHSDDQNDDDPVSELESLLDSLSHSDDQNDEKTLADVYATLDEDQEKLFEIVVSAILKSN